MAQTLPQLQPAATGKGSIEGVVVDGSSRSPLRKVQITMSGALPEPLKAVTDSEGRFFFRDLPAGPYYLNAVRPGYNPPQSLVGLEGNYSLNLADGEQKKNVALSLMSGASISGRVTNEEGAAIRNCTVSAVQPAYEQNRRTLRVLSGINTDDRGQFRIQNLAAGTYSLFAQCAAELPAAHPLMARGDPRTPHETYRPQSSALFKLSAGAALEDKDFQMTRLPTLTLRGTITAVDAGVSAGALNVMLMPADPSMRNLLMQSGIVDAQSGRFEISPVIPGSYTLMAIATHDGRSYSAQRLLEVGTAAPGPLEITLTAGVDLKGKVQFDCEDHPPLEHVQAMLDSPDGNNFVQPPRCDIDQDGNFTFAGVMPGRWRLTITTQGYLKSVTMAGQPAPPQAIPIGPGGGGPLHVLMGCKLAQVNVEVPGASASRQVSGLLFPADLEQLGTGMDRAGGMVFGALPPGRYRILATDIPNPWPLLERPDVLRALENHTTVVEVPEGANLSITVDLLPRDELLRALDQ